MEKKSKNVFQKVIDIILWVFLGFALLLTIMAVSANFSGKEYPVFGNTCMLTVQSDSMNGTDGKGFAKGDIIFGKVLKNSTEKDNLEVGQVVTFYVDLDGDGEKELNTHRIIDVKKNNGFTYYTTKGDHPDIKTTETVLGEDCEAVWTGTKLKGLGVVVDFLQSSTGFLICVVLPMAGLFIYELVIFVLTISKYKNEKNGSVNSFSKEEEELIKQKAIEEYLAKQNSEKK